jgi:hypothetical protein
MQTAEETLYTDEQSYALGNLAKLQAIEPALKVAVGKGAQPQAPTVAADNYTVSSKSVTGTTFTIKKNADGTVERSCDKAGDYGCPSSGTW